MSDLAKQLAGKFIVIDGPDGAGKSTQIKLLTDFLSRRGITPTVCRDPGGTAIGDKIRAILLDNAHDEMAVECELMLYMASRSQLVKQIIKPALQKKACVLCDRYVSATIAYQGAGGVDAQTVMSVAKAAVRNCWPDLTVILDIPPQAGLARAASVGAADRVEVKSLEFHSRVRESFLQQAKACPAKFAIVDAIAQVDEVQARLQAAILNFAKPGGA
jgi:dTMP kinase